MIARPYPSLRATYRLQLNRHFTFRQVAELAPYLAGLGISHAYLSPILRARKGSSHGYDTVEHREINPELGGLDEFRAMARTLRDRGLGILLDFVPNHMGIGGAENAYWLDLLEWGRHSRYAHWFDIDWTPSDATLKNRVLVPFLGQSYDEALRAGHLRLHFDRAAGAFAIWADATHRLPIKPSSYVAILSRAGEALQPLAAAFASLPTAGHEQAQGLKSALAALCTERLDVSLTVERIVDQLNETAADGDALDLLIAQQNWRVARFSVAADDINYRRFFIVNDLVGIRVEEEDVFDHVHALIFQLIDEGLVDGLRIDHIDGLFDPKVYCRTLRSKCPRPIYLVVEKLLAPHERLRPEWVVDGTTGYEFAARVTSLLADPVGERELNSAYAAFTGRGSSFADIEREAKLVIIDDEMTAELDALATRLRKLAAADRGTADLTRNGLKNALRHFVASMPVYRTYVDRDGASDADRRNIASALASARRAAPSLDPATMDFLASVMALNVSEKAAALEAVRRIQQYTGPVMAKGLEDTALYRYNRLIALNEVGARPDRFATNVAAFHDFNSSRQMELPDGLLATSTHDTKRGEDARARIMALTGHATEWSRLVFEWHRLLLDAGAPNLDPNDVWLFFQLLLGSWPIGFAEQGPLDGEELLAFAARLHAAMLKSAREARTHSSWAAPNSDYEQRLARLVEIALSGGADNRFLASFREFETRIARAGMQNSLIMAALKLTAPGIPDIYQGAELWEQSLVDPDNRRPVDFVLRRSLLPQALADAPPRTLSGWRDGHLKLDLITRLLRLRTADPELFARGSYEPLTVEGSDKQRLCAFLRRRTGRAIIVATSLWPWRGPSEPSTLTLPDDLRSERWHDIVSGRDFPPREHLCSDELFKDGPVAVLTPVHDPATLR